ncbi:hypothetical protein TELCIR_23915, partial [Teladorsagia circumcincta]
TVVPLTLDERVEIVLLAGDRNHREVAEDFNRLHPGRRPITRSCVSRLMTKLKETGSISDRPRPGRPRRTTCENTASAVLDRFRRNPAMSLRRMASETGMSRSSIHRILRANKCTEDVNAQMKS